MTGAVLTGFYLIGAIGIQKAFLIGASLLTDDRPLVEYHRSLPRGSTPLDLSGFRSDFAEVVRSGG